MKLDNINQGQLSVILYHLDVGAISANQAALLIDKLYTEASEDKESLPLYFLDKNEFESILNAWNKEWINMNDPHVDMFEDEVKKVAPSVNIKYDKQLCKYTVK